MTSALTHLRWDSEFFGISVARADIQGGGVEAAAREADTQGVACLYLFVDSAHPLALSDALQRGGRLVDLRLELDLSTPLALPTGIRRADPDEVAGLRPLARSLAADSRFSADPRFAADVIREMYDIWLDRCFDEGFVVVPDGRFRGFVGARVRNDTTLIELVYLDARSRGHGVAARLVSGAVAMAGASRARVATQAWNVAAQRLYQGVGFRTASLQAIVHLWLSEATSRSP
jgi:GNAT superfamily N-acetyltransferase